MNTQQREPTAIPLAPVGKEEINMLIQINCGSNVQGSEPLRTYMESLLRKGLHKVRAMGGS